MVQQAALIKLSVDCQGSMDLHRAKFVSGGKQQWKSRSWQMCIDLK